MNLRASTLLLSILATTPVLDAVTTLQDTRNFFPDYNENPVSATQGAPDYYFGSDLYSAAIEGPDYPRLALEWEAGILFYLNRDVSNIDGKYMHHGFNTSFGFPLSRKIRPNHYLNLELLAGYDSVEVSDGTTSREIEAQQYSLLINYKYYTPPILRDRIFPHLTIGIGNSFKEIEDTTTIIASGTTTGTSEWDSSIFTMQGAIGARARLTKHLGIHTGYHLIYVGENHNQDGDFLHALDLGLSVIF